MFETEENHGEADLLNEEEGEEEIDAETENGREPLVRSKLLGKIQKDLGNLQIVTRPDSHNNYLARTQDS